MTDRFLSRAWWVITLSLIALTGSGALFMAYRGVFNTFAGAYVPGALNLLACIPPALGCYLLCRHRSDLVTD